MSIIAGGKIRFEGKVSEARDRLRPQVRLETRKTEGAWRTALPAGAEREDHVWHFPLPEGGVEPLLKALIEGDAGIEALAIERPGLPDAFVAIAGEAVLRVMDEGAGRQEAPGRNCFEPLLSLRAVTSRLCYPPTLSFSFLPARFSR